MGGSSSKTGLSVNVNKSVNVSMGNIIIPAQQQIQQAGKDQERYQQERERALQYLHKTVYTELEDTLASTIDKEWSTDVAVKTNVERKDSIVLSYNNELKRKEMGQMIETLMAGLKDISNAAVMGGLRSMASTALKAIVDDKTGKMNGLARDTYRRLEFKEGPEDNETGYRVEYAAAFKYLKITEEQALGPLAALAAYIPQVTGVQNKIVEYRIGIHYKLTCTLVKPTEDMITYAKLMTLGLVSDRYLITSSEDFWENVEPAHWGRTQFAGFLESFNRGKYLDMLYDLELDPYTIFDTNSGVDEEDLVEMFFELDSKGMRKVIRKTLCKRCMALRSIYQENGKDGWHEVYEASFPTKR